MSEIRVLAAAGVVLFAAGWAVGWFEQFSPEVGAPTFALRPWWAALILVALLVAALVPLRRRFLTGAAVVVAPAIAATVLAFTLRPRQVARDVPIGDVVRDRTLGQALSLCGAVFVVMALCTAFARTVRPS